MAERALWFTFHDAHNAFRKQLGLAAHGFDAFRRATYRAPLLLGFSEHVMPRPADFEPNCHITGYWFVDEPDWQPPEALTRFLAAGPAPVYIGFGSATDRAAQDTTRTILDAVKRSGARALISGGWAGLDTDQSHGPELMFIGGMPHSWLFPRMGALVHHGGAGTTGAGVRAGLPALLIPHFAEQPLWAKRLHQLGVSPPPLPKRKLNANALASGIEQMLSDTGMRARAAALGAAVRAEDGVARAVALFEQLLTSTIHTR
jgi:UDP:flavonoid glycosyltransferase YjiC (YdhE family)